MDNNYAEASMAIRKPVNQVFEAFIDPNLTVKFWFTESTGHLVENISLTWHWPMYNVIVPVKVLKIEENSTIEIDWGEGDQKSRVRWTFTPVAKDLTYVKIKNFNFKSKGDNLISQIRDSTGGFHIVLCGLKAYLEHGIELNLIDDKWPAELR